jgi:hypothetical protein
VAFLQLFVLDLNKKKKYSDQVPRSLISYVVHIIV